MQRHLRSPRPALALAVLAALALPAGAQDRVDARAAWRPGAGFMPAVRSHCANAEPGRYGECLIAQMAEAGAGAPAVSFSTRLLAASGQTGIARDVRAAGRIAIAYVFYPLRANENLGWLLVGADGAWVDVDDPEQRPWEGLAHDATYRALLQAHPRLALFPGDRAGTREPRVEPLPDGGQRAVVRYRLTDGCHACALLGTASVGFDFDADGQFAGPTLLGVEATR